MPQTECGSGRAGVCTMPELDASTFLTHSVAGVVISRLICKVPRDRAEALRRENHEGEGVLQFATHRTVSPVFPRCFGGSGRDQSQRRVHTSGVLSLATSIARLNLYGRGPRSCIQAIIWRSPSSSDTVGR